MHTAHRWGGGGENNSERETQEEDQEKENEERERSGGGGERGGEGEVEERREGREVVASGQFLSYFPILFSSFAVLLFSIPLLVY